ncbi:hypothetical protein D9757_001017 [Collybiopsis confluens]|uniref:Uncharacterized protein n=1 Tax=Collybiopsis confluens TaxID=2823264 RepID=A0A8H5I091_9AGAR|nr:hypothetical protein D9757_001017 [Collybiopsis confluens]
MILRPFLESCLAYRFRTPEYPTYPIFYILPLPPLVVSIDALSLYYVDLGTSVPFWKARFGAECVSAVVQGTLTSRAPKYSIILDLDRKVRDMAVPKYAQGPIPESAGLNQTMSHCMPVNYRELTLIYIHRCFFTHAIQSSPMDPIKSQYAPSFLAGYRSACDLLEAVRKQFNKFPAQIARFWVLWTHAFSSTVMISSVVTHGSRSKVAPAALLELKSAYELFREASNHGGRAIKFLPIVQRLLDKAQKVFFETSSGVPPSVPNDIFSPSGSAPDEISVFSGKTHTVTTKVNRVSNHRSPSNGTSRGSESPSGSPAQNFTTANPSFAGVHPSLVQELNGFDGHIAAQLQNAYNNHHEDFNEVLMGARVSQQQQQQRYQTEQLAHQQYENQQQRELEEQQRLQRNMIEEQMIRQREEERQRAAEEDAYAQAQARHHHPTLHYTYDGSPTAESSLSIAHGVPMPAPVQDEPMQDQRRTLAHSHSHPNLHRDYDQAPHAGPSNRFRYDSVAPPGSHVRRQQSPARPSQPRQQHRSTNSRSQHPHPHSRQHPHQHPRQHPPPSPHSHQAHPPPPQHEMYAIPPGYMSNHHSPSSSDIAVSPTSSTHSHAYPSPETVFNSPVVQGAYWSNGHHASAAPEGVVYTDHPPPSRQPLVGPPHHQQHPQYYSIPRTTPVSHLPQYTPEAAMQGMAAEDPRLQETWQSYMSNVTSSRLMLDD